jgi:hypothetical protein
MSYDDISGNDCILNHFEKVFCAAAVEYAVERDVSLPNRQALFELGIDPNQFILQLERLPVHLSGDNPFI